ncbi:hypothetical protein M0L20_08935 [Spirosoma sp. RP8]|uniref:Outer membrane beta-barrel protein n=1 Tax=Spirosoma liriopis TaxID=2937440 RepID=A0ABT0HII1_9BACT|nr:hypothetical protein [Spirosoma liriopis]MCK8491972.1 hypothetical protein [Spirosoma liriopis]
MDELEKNIPDDFWRKAFDEASEAPPPRVWDAIEHRLDESNNPKILPLWGAGLLASKSFTWGAGIAAALALLLVGWWLTGTQSTNSQIAHQPKAVPYEQHLTAPDNQQSLSATESDEKPSVAPEAVAIAGKQPKHSASTGSLANKPSTEPSVTITEDQLLTQRMSYRVKEHLPEAEPMLRSQAMPTGSARAVAISSTENRAFAATVNRAAVATAIVHDETDALYASQIEQLAFRPMRLRSLDEIHRIVWFRPAELSAEPDVVKPKHESKEVWASVSMMPSSFNPSVAIRSAQPAMFTASANANQPSINSRANFSVAYQAGAGVQLTERWSVESGVGYLAGHSTVQSPNQVGMSMVSDLLQSTNRNATAGNLYVNAVRNSANNVAADVMNSAPVGNYSSVSASNFQAYDARHQQDIANNYEYVQVPVQIGYQLRPRKRLSMALLGGLLTNIFVRNTIGDELVITGKDGVYRPLALAATMGARFRYRPSRRWSASLAGMYQPSLGVGTRSESQVESSPTSAGMSFGLDYHF